MSRPKEFDGPPTSVRLTAKLQDQLCRIALRRDEPLADVIREAMARFVVENAAQAQTSA